MSAPTLGGNWRERLARLAIGWDNYDGKPITAAAIATVEQIAVVPCSSGGVQLEIHKSGFDIEIDISADGQITSTIVEVASNSRETR